MTTEAAIHELSENELETVHGGLTLAEGALCVGAFVLGMELGATIANDKSVGGSKVVAATLRGAQQALK